MFYLQRTGSADQEGPYSFEYLKQMARNGELFAGDLIIPAEGGGSFRASENLEFGDLPKNPETHRPPVTDTAYPNPPADNKVSRGTIAILVAVGLISLCCIPSFFLFRGTEKVAAGEETGIASVDAMTALRQVTQATATYANDWDTFYPSGMDEGDRWQSQISPYLPSGAKFSVDGKPIEANPNLARIRRGTIIEPRLTLMYFIREPVLGEQSAVSNADGEIGYVASEGLKDSISRNIYNVPFESNNRRRRGR